MVVALTVDDEERESDFGEVIIDFSTCRGGERRNRQPPALVVYPIASSRGRRVLVPAFAGTTRGKTAGASNLAGDGLLHLVGALDQPPPRTLHERHHDVHGA